LEVAHGFSGFRFIYAGLIPTLELTSVHWFIHLAPYWETPRLGIAAWAKPPLFGHISYPLTHLRVHMHAHPSRRPQGM
jgi:hypothetical protein